MNKYQRFALFMTAGILLLMLLFPPWYSIRSSHMIKINQGYGFILSPPTTMVYWDAKAERQTTISFKKDIMSDERWDSLPHEKQQEMRKVYFKEEKGKYPKIVDSDLPAMINIYQLLAQCIIVAFIGGIFWFAMKTKD